MRQQLSASTAGCCLSRIWGEDMSTWRPSEKQLKRYPHFDDVISLDEIVEFVNDPKAVAAHSFFPFILFEKTWQPFRSKAPRPKPTVRPIRDAARRDAYVFMRYRSLLAERYEAKLNDFKLTDCVIAYRKIPVGNGRRGGKCNIHFAKDAFEAIQGFGNCSALVIDISSYFESLDHGQLKKVWGNLIDQERLPPDHWAVFKAITAYSVVDRKAVYERLGLYGEKRRSKSGLPINGYLVPAKKMHSRLCTLSDFRRKIVGGDTSLPSLIQVNGKHFNQGKPKTGIPQGSPISDILANAYLLDFDRRVSQMVAAKGGRYVRYSDDILIVLPGDATAAVSMKEALQSLIREYGPHLQIEDRKTAIAEFRKTGDQVRHHWFSGKGKNGLEYLGFRFDGSRVYLKDGTVSNFARKVSAHARISAKRWVARYPGKSPGWLIENFDIESLIKKFGRIEDFEAIDDIRKWTFWTYVQRSSEVFGPMGTRIIPQLSKHRKFISDRAVAAITDFHKKFEESKLPSVRPSPTN
jgi:hypothetical protein